MATEKVKKKKGSVISSAVRGRWLSTRFFSRNWGIILALVVLVMIYITNRYQCLTAMENIQKLNKELEVIKSERIRQKSEYMNAIREKTMQKSIREAGLDLTHREQPPFKLKITK
ncbi:MAG: hypothetical protein BHV79_18025 [Bacteroides uniformis]|jgi:hypothetical protein|uniref:Cell division protein FtsL n=1 Tax=Bacteroides uniformis TaxID=820 RepID=A0A1Q6HQD3_BACUN|nr:MAG: hypothetical protein BHV79_18025 [Bacteroides uniformis]